MFNLEAQGKCKNEIAEDICQQIVITNQKFNPDMKKNKNRKYKFITRKEKGQ